VACRFDSTDNDGTVPIRRAMVMPPVTRRTPPSDEPPPPPVPPHILVGWFGVMASAGLAFGLIADRRPFGTDMFAHPLFVFFFVVGAGLLVLRAVLRRPVPEVIPDRMLFVGCLLGIILFLIGNWLGTRLLAPL
jgi:hypothetical protein